MARGEADAAFPLDQIGDPPRRPQGRAVAVRLRPRLQRLLDAHQVRSAQSRLATGAASPFQGGSTANSELLCPAINGLPMDTNSTRHLGFGVALFKQSGCLHPPPLQSLEVPPYACWVAHVRRLTEKSLLVTIFRDSL